MQNLNLEEILNKYKKGTCTAEELAWLENWYLQWKVEPHVFTEENLQGIKDEVWQSMVRNDRPAKHIKLWLLIAAASILIIAGTAGYFYVLKYKSSDQVQMALAKTIIPGSNKAVLTLANGDRISLTDARSGQIAMQSGIQITKAADGQLIYTASEKGLITGRDNTTLYNTIETPNGGQWQVILPDHSHVWLNAQSSIKYPLTFTGSERKVELTGEAYFEVVHNKSKPFRVVSRGQTVEVLGTHFNVNSYLDEHKTITTLEEGSVKVSTGTLTKNILPGQQAIMTTNHFTIQAADLETALAWKSGSMEFKGADIQSIMRQVSRWYDIEVEYRGVIPERRFAGSVSRKAKLSTVLELLRQSRISFLIEQEPDGRKKLIVKP